MAGSSNGMASVADTRPLVGALDLADCAYERVPIRVKLNGEQQVFSGWVSGPGCPGRITAEFSRVFARYLQSEDDDDAKTAELMTEGLRVVLEIDYLTADLLAAGGRGGTILRHLGFLAPLREATAGPEAQGEASTTHDSSPSSSAATAVSGPTAAAG